LSNAGFRVDTVLNGAEAVRAAAAKPYDAILMDCQMPELDGYEATVAIRAHEGSGRHTPIIAMTAGARPEDRVRCLAGGMDSYLAKPVSKDALLALVAASLKEKSPPRAGVLPDVDHISVAEITLDPVVFDELRVLGGHSEAFVGELVDQFVLDTDLLLVDLREVFESGDTIAVSCIAHNIKGSAGQLGARRLASSCGRLETQALVGLRSEAPTSLREVETDYQELRRALAQESSVD
jgi:CheY-like chemotaxis protein